MAAPSSVSAIEVGELTPPGRFADVGTHRLYYRCAGAGRPLVIIDSGLGGAAIEWTEVQSRLEARATVCTYDRAGYGWSDPGPSPRTTRRAVTELRALLQAAKLTPPYILVGHSLGGFNVRYFAAKYPTEVAGLVLIESSHPLQQMSRVTTASGAHDPFLGNSQAPDTITDRNFAVAHYLNTRRKAVFAQMDEMRNFERSARQVEAIGALPRIPLLVLTRDPRRGLKDLVAESHWQSYQLTLSKLSPLGEFQIAPNSNHEIHRQHPELAAAAILSIIHRRNLDVSLRH